MDEVEEREDDGRLPVRVYQESRDMRNDDGIGLFLLVDWT